MTRPPMTAAELKGTVPPVPLTAEEWHAMHMASARETEERLIKIALKVCILPAYYEQQLASGGHLGQAFDTR